MNMIELINFLFKLCLDIDCIRYFSRSILVHHIAVCQILNLSLNFSQTSLDLVWFLAKNESECSMIFFILLSVQCFTLVWIFSQISLNLVWFLAKNESEFSLILCILSLISVVGGLERDDKRTWGYPRRLFSRLLISK